MGRARASHQQSDYCDKAHERVRTVHLKYMITIALTTCSDLDQMRSILNELGYDVPRKRYGFADDVQEETEEDNDTTEPPADVHVRGESALASCPEPNSRCLYAAGLTYCQQSTTSTDLRPHRGNGNVISAKWNLTIRTNKSLATRSG
jgi:hypothetical protein